MAPRLLAGWDEEDEALRFTLAALAAATGHRASLTRVRRPARRRPTGPRSYALRLAAAPAGGDGTEVTAVLRELVAGGGVRPRLLPSPPVSAHGGASAMLSNLVERETRPLWRA